MTNEELLQEFAKYVRVIGNRAMSASETKKYINVTNEIITRMGGRVPICQYCNENNSIHYNGQFHVCQECIDWVDEQFDRTEL